MSRREDRPKGPTELRRHAEAALSGRQNGTHADDATPDTVRLVHELQVHQVELEMQNEELVRSRAELEAALARYSELYEFAPVGYFTIGEGDAIDGTNLTGARLMGVERSRLVGRGLASFVADDDRETLKDALTRAREGGAPASCTVTVAQQDPASAKRTLQITASAAPGEVTCRVVVQDVTERTRAEEQARTSQRLEAIGQLAGGVAHDFNNLLTVILAHSDEALAAVSAEAPLHGNLVELRAAALRGADLTRQLLAFSRRQVRQTRVLDVNPLVRSVASMLRRLLGENIELALSLDADSGRIAVDPSQFDQVLMNLAVNARDAMPDGGSLTLATRNVEVDEARAQALGLSVKPGPFVLLSVSDTGIGMDHGLLAHIFEPFFTTKKVGEGTGLGLATVYGIVEQCGGDVAVESALERGTTFAIYLPRTQASLTPSASEKPRSRAPCTETVLIVEDEAPLRRIAERILKSEGYTVLSGGDGAEALRVAEGHPGTIHLVLSDMLMPGMTGLVFASRLKGVHPEAKVLFMSGYPDGAFGPSGPDAATHFLGKPFSPAQLRDKVREVLDASSTA